MTDPHGKFDLALRGFGEAATAFASGWNREKLHRLCAFDEKIDDATERPAIVERCDLNDVVCCATAQEAYGDADIVVSLVYADRALDAARDTAQYLGPGTLYIDGNSCSPQTKARAAHVLEPGGTDYVDMAIMAPVYPKKQKTPILLAGPKAEQAAAVLVQLGMSPRVVGERVGQASAIKLTRSVMIKGMEAVIAECFLAARLGGVEDEVLASLEASDPDIDWKKKRAYTMDRMTVHGRRRAAEMVEAANMVAELGLPDDMARATAKWEQLLGDLPIKSDSVDEVLAALGKF
ncbi:NAD(P)-dependent oxidoreductase [Pelagibacterium halotolerans]|uniref:3-hydroxyisobutyrate dehydrogenase-related beta-hydroxyacid dehydrogenase n=1 Tax=Pelagibacterium halotolerans (strain DSM 22347 / JCM 15775 / CGMCC 1.7692 / B2) TaxID=1082931 RepID=G4RCF0_PELHB|nr:DUF1932 domain-containing protein [Pelagibacterium halotolerans]AEQ53744.1 3-hydroxyisobutyrate dehydrogenase-related beta-hydroxyacid dehydrogenase [Pelagibacterium halotolerans B2]QJR20094.1 NAD(P)-dependent oxidoreductase [Pelagibacterium halotolerans]SEA80061.1 3-hydroxyisobutyrate dehydrogenase [Pelagibacterium halotolerans]